MKTFEYKGYTAAGALRKGMVEALHPKGARERLARDGILVEKLSISGARAGAVSADMRAVLYRELSALLSAGTPLVAALDTLIATPEMRTVAGVLGTVRDRVREGSTLANSLGDSRAAGTPFELATIEVAERAASLETVLEQLADFIDAHERMRERIQHAMIYPTLVLGLGLCVAIVMLGVLLPKTREIMGGSVESMPLLTRIMLVVGDGVWPWGVVGMALVAAAVVAWRRRVAGDQHLCVQRDRRRFRVPLVGRGYALLAGVRFARTLAILVRAGVPLVEGVPLAGRATGSPWVEELADAETESLRHGASLADAVRRITPLAELLPGWIEVGEASGSLADLLDRAAERCQARWDRFLARGLALMEPALLLFVGAFVLLIALSVLLPVFTLSSSIAR